MHRWAQRGGIEYADTATYEHFYARPPGGGFDPFAGERARSQEVTSGATTGPILIVDDDRAILTTIAEILELEGYPFITAGDGAEALRQVAAAQPCLVLLDMRMPVLNGWEVARALRERGIATPIVVMTAAQDARLWSEQIDAAGYLAKPFDLDDLLDMIARFLPL